MKSKKLSISELAGNELLEQSQLASYVGGYDYLTGTSCFFNCMEYIGKECYKIEGYDHNWYGNQYWQGYGEYVGTGNMGDYLYGPDLYGEGDKINGNISNYIGAMFGSAATDFVYGSDVADLFADGHNEGVMGIIRTPDGGAHAVIIQNYNPVTGLYSYFDPSKEMQGENQTFTAADLIGAIDCKEQ
ncbi:MAG: hypothetical protein HUK01_02185 [Bacteroidaceae bacterium]|nr:hypothetical protein [Bacteroidaceae bacterium]